VRNVCFINVIICGSHFERKLKIISEIVCLADVNTVNIFMQFPRLFHLYKAVEVFFSFHFSRTIRTKKAGICLAHWLHLSWAKTMILETL